MSAIKVDIKSALRSAKTKPVTLFLGDAVQLAKKIPNDSVDLIVTSPPYCIGMPYEKKRTLEDFIVMHEALLPECERILKVGGHLCWQVGYNVTSKRVEPLDFYVHDILRQTNILNLRNRIIWEFGHGTHATKRFSGRHELILWYSKGHKYHFDLDEVRVPQKYPGKKHYKGPKKGDYSGNPLGKNPGDVWDIPNVKAYHVEKTDHPCQFPVALVQRIVRSLTRSGDLIFDPFIGSGSTGVAAALEGRRVIGADTEIRYLDAADSRIKLAQEGKAKFRPIEQPVHLPRSGDPINIPEHFKFK